MTETTRMADYVIAPAMMYERPDFNIIFGPFGIYSPATNLGNFVLTGQTGSQLTGPPVTLDSAGSSNNITGQPAVSLPLHWSADGLPIGVQLVAAYGREDVLLAVAAQLESAQPWSGRRPPVDAGQGGAGPTAK